MIEPRRWIDEDATQAERRLLLSARDDAPRSVSRDKLFVALGIGGATAIGTAAATAAQLSTAATLAASSAAVALGKAAPGGAGITALAIMKWVGVGAIAGLITTGTATVMVQRTSSAATKPDAAVDKHERNERTSVVYAPAALPAEAAAIEPPALAEPEPAALPVPEPARIPQQKASVPGPKVANGVPATNVAKEVSTLDRAREALAVGDAPTAMQALGQHESEFASGVLGPEAELLRIQALLARGEYNSAAVMARGFLMKNPKSPHVGRVRSLLAQAKLASAPAKSD